MISKPETKLENQEIKNIENDKITLKTNFKKFSHKNHVLC